LTQDPRFNKIVDKKTGYRTTSILCMPILDYEDEIIGVAQVMNKMAGENQPGVFTKEDEQVSLRDRRLHVMGCSRYASCSCNVIVDY